VKGSLNMYRFLVADVLVDRVGLESESVLFVIIGKDCLFALG